MNKGIKLTSAAFGALLIMVFLLWKLDKSSAEGAGDALLLYCAAGSKPAVLPLAEAYEQKYGKEIHLMYGGSGTLLSNIQVSRKGDLFIAADESYIEMAADKNLISAAFSLAIQRAVIGVKMGNPKNIRSLGDLQRNDIRLALGNPDAASIGRHTRIILMQAGIWSEVKKRVEMDGVFKPSVPEIANDIKLGAVDAGIIWTATVAQYPDLEAVIVPQFNEVPMRISVAVLNSSRQPEEALRFARYLNSAEGKAQFVKQGFEAVEGQ